MITVHHLESSRSHRVLWLLEELGVPYELKTYRRRRDLRAPGELRQVHPLGKSPVITDSETGITVAESGAILEYLVERYDSEGKLRPAAASPQRWQYSYWLHYAEGSLMPQLLLALIFGLLPKQPMPFFVKPVAKKISETVKAKTYGPELKNHMDFIEHELERSTYLAGEAFTAADIQMSYPLEMARERAEALDGRPKLAAYLERLRARSAYQRALDRGGPISLPI